MKLQSRDKRALVLLAVAASVMLLYLALSGDGASSAVAAPVDSIPAAEKRLARVRKRAAQAPGLEQALRQVSAELATREKGLIQADTAAQAQAQLIDIIKRVARAQQPPIDLGGVELSRQITQLGDNYGEVQVSLPFVCRIEDLVNFLADISRQPEALTTTDLRVSVSDVKQKTLAVRLTVAGAVPKRLIPQKKAVQF
jgi:hypothetical protein